jgi:hypothetical protein
MAREIHDTLARQFAGILLHLEAANGLGGAMNGSESLAHARDLAKSGLEDARRMLLGAASKVPRRHAFVRRTQSTGRQQDRRAFGDANKGLKVEDLQRRIERNLKDARGPG